MSWHQNAIRWQIIGKNIMIVGIALSLYVHSAESTTNAVNSKCGTFGIFLAVVGAVMAITMYVLGRLVPANDFDDNVVKNNVHGHEHYDAIGTFQTETSDMKQDVVLQCSDEIGAGVIRDLNNTDNDGNKVVHDKNITESEHIGVNEEQPFTIVKEHDIVVSHSDDIVEWIVDDEKSKKGIDQQNIFITNINGEALGSEWRIPETMHDDEITNGKQCVDFNLDNENSSRSDWIVHADVDDGSNNSNHSDLHSNECGDGEQQQSYVADITSGQSDMEWIIDEDGTDTMNKGDMPLIFADFDKRSHTTNTSRRKTATSQTKVKPVERNEEKPSVRKKTISNEPPARPDLLEDDSQSSMFQRDYQCFCELQKIDMTLVTYTNDLVRLITEIGAIGTQRKEALKNISMSGSAREGAMVSRIFKPSKENKKELNMEVECDLEFNLVSIPATHKYLVEDIPDKRGFLNLRADMELVDFANEIGWNVDVQKYAEVVNEVTENGYLKPHRMKEVALRKTKMKEKDRALELIIAAAFGVDPDRVSLSQPVQEITKSSIGNDVALLIDNETKLNFSWDLVFVMQIEWWPTVANEFIERARAWPDKDVISLLTRSGYIITKPSVDEKSENDTIELRYSFAHVERDLVILRSNHQNLVYLIFKSMIYKWLKPIAPDYLHSFMGKTVMFWTCEKYPSDHPLWNSDSETRTLLALNHLFSELLKAFKNGFLPYYFIPEINVIPNLSNELGQKVIGQIELILDDLITYIPYTVKEVINSSRGLLQLMKSACYVLDRIKHKDYSVLINRPELIPKLLKLFLQDTNLETELARNPTDDNAVTLDNIVNDARELTGNLRNVQDASDILRAVNDFKKIGKDVKEVLKVSDSLKNAKKIFKKFKF